MDVNLIGIVAKIAKTLSCIFFLFNIGFHCFRGKNTKYSCSDRNIMGSKLFTF